MENLNPYIDADPDIKHEYLLENILDSMEINGGLYEIFGEFTIATSFGPASLIGGKENWNYDSLRETAAENVYASVFGSDREDKMSLLYFIIENSGTKLVGWSKGEFYFDSEYFMNVLEKVSASCKSGC